MSHGLFVGDRTKPGAGGKFALTFFDKVLNVLCQRRHQRGPGALPVYPMNGHRLTGPPCPVGADINDLQRAIAPAKASRGGNAALRAMRLRMYSAIRIPSGADNQMQIRSEAVL